jgi:O-antigen ligase
MFGLPIGGAASLEEGSPLDALFYATLIAAGVCVLARRQINLGQVIAENPWLAAFFIYCFLAIFWSDFPFVSFKRWIKVVGHPVMVLVLFTEPDPREAIVRLIKRSAYVLVPVSVLFIKYFPQYGRRYSFWTGEPMYIGISSDKNMLGAICVVLAMFFFWHFLQVRRSEKSIRRRDELRWIVFFLLMIAYLLRQAHSATATVSLLIGIAIITSLGLRSINKRLIMGYAITAVIVLVIAQLGFDIFGSFVALSGHGKTFQSRQQLWEELFRIKINPVIGTGFESFWLGDRLDKIWSAVGWRANEAHNGYLETYLNLGLLGLGILVGLLITTFSKARRELLRNFEWGRFRMGYLVAVIAYNWTEASFRGLSPMWFVFYIIAIDHRRREENLLEQVSEADFVEEERKLVYTPVPGW